MTSKHLNKRLTVIVATAMLAAVSAFGSLFLFGCVGSSAARISREHGLKLPSSSHKFVCRGDAWMHTFMDSGAASAFEMDSRDLPAFVSQLKLRDHGGFGENDILPSNPQYQIHRPWMSGPPLKTYHSDSPTGDSLDLQIWRIDNRQVGVLLYTDWN